MLKGHCLCGEVRFEVTGQPQGISVCHCGQCRRQSGHAWASAYVSETEITISGDTLQWYRSSPEAERGFCNRCGSFLFWRMDVEDTISFSLGSLDMPTGLALEKHIFVNDKGDYYKIADDVPREPLDLVND